MNDGYLQGGRKGEKGRSSWKSGSTFRGWGQGFTAQENMWTRPRSLPRLKPLA